MSCLVYSNVACEVSYIATLYPTLAPIWDGIDFVADKKTLGFLDPICMGIGEKTFCPRIKSRTSLSGPSCSKLTTSLVNDSLKFTSSDTQIC